MPHPIRAKYTVPYGAAFGAGRANGARKHAATDYHCPQGTAIYGTGDGGVVTHIGYNGDPWLGLGHNITIKYPGGRTTIDAHMRESPTKHGIRVGSTIGANTLIGYVGLTGNAVNASPPGAHDHHEVRIFGVLINPEAYYGRSPSVARVDAAPIDIPIPKKRKPMTIAHIKEPTSSTVFALDLSDGTKPLRAIRAGELVGGNKAGIDLAEIASVELQGLMRERGVFVQDKFLRLTPFAAAKPDPSLINWQGFAVLRPS